MQNSQHYDDYNYDDDDDDDDDNGDDDDNDETFFPKITWHDDFWHTFDYCKYQLWWWWWGFWKLLY